MAHTEKVQAHQTNAIGFQGHWLAAIQHIHDKEHVELSFFSSQR